jgi:hypothetical protein
MSSFKKSSGSSTRAGGNSSEPPKKRTKKEGACANITNQQVFQVFVKTPNGTTVAINVSSHTTTSELTELISLRTCSSADISANMAALSYLVYDGNKMAANRTMEECKITKHATLMLRSRIHNTNAEFQLSAQKTTAGECSISTQLDMNGTPTPTEINPEKLSMETAATHAPQHPAGSTTCLACTRSLPSKSVLFSNLAQLGFPASASTLLVKRANERAEEAQIIAEEAQNNMDSGEEDDEGDDDDEQQLERQQQAKAQSIERRRALLKLHVARVQKELWKEQNASSIPTQPDMNSTPTSTEINPEKLSDDTKLCGQCKDPSDPSDFLSCNGCAKEGCGDCLECDWSYCMDCGSDTLCKVCREEESTRCNCCRRQFCCAAIAKKCGIDFDCTVRR